ncbi:hypothetical protein AVEN_223027-1 [Araneus ventricosus]|uniref:Uncharacterized protein n=1 Tax=Araneus ventricosus TaxID=182803 RepID=A0A4Y2V057_ARAVE|nr:hypothetical protein AVEN_223027-1 [Araneus ventricosus]
MTNLRHSQTGKGSKQFPHHTSRQSLVVIAWVKYTERDLTGLALLWVRYCPTATRKTLNRLTSNRRDDESREAAIKSTASLSKRTWLGEEFISDRSTK